MADIDNGILLMITEAKTKLQDLQSNISLKERLKTAMKATFNHWMITDENKQFQAAIAAVLFTASEEEKIQIKNELQQLKIITAMINSIPIDWKKYEEDKPNYEPIGLVKLWEEIEIAPSHPQE